MGCLQSKKAEPQIQALDKEVRDADPRQSAISLSHENKNDHKRIGTDVGNSKGMTRLAMKSHKIRQSFRCCKIEFDEMAGDREDYISKKDVKTLLVKLGANEVALTDEKMKCIVSSANLDEDDKIDFKEFLIAAAVGLFLTDDSKVEVENKTCSETFESNREGFLICKEAFDSIDVDGSGAIDYEEMKTSFVSIKGSPELVAARFKELDFDKDNDIEFPEFLWGLTKWIGMDPDEDAELQKFEDDAIDKNTTFNALGSGGPVADDQKE